MRPIQLLKIQFVLVFLCCLAANAQLKELQALPDTPSPEKNVTLQGRAELQDPDRNDKAILIEWDKWHNHFAKAATQRFNTSLFGDDAINLGGIPIKLGTSPMRRFPQGLKATTTCEVTLEQKIQNLHIVKSSGVAEFDNLVLRAVKGLEGKPVLKFPKGSQRRTVAESDNFWVGSNPGFHKRDLGDVEKLR